MMSAKNSRDPGTYALPTDNMPVIDSFAAIPGLPPLFFQMTANNVHSVRDTNVGSVKFIKSMMDAVSVGTEIPLIYVVAPNQFQHYRAQDLSGIPQGYLKRIKQYAPNLVSGHESIVAPPAKKRKT